MAQLAFPAQPFDFNQELISKESENEPRCKVQQGDNPNVAEDELDLFIRYWEASRRWISDAPELRALIPSETLKRFKERGGKLENGSGRPVAWVDERSRNGGQRFHPQKGPALSTQDFYLTQQKPVRNLRRHSVSSSR
jgi:hypothetical protein